MNRIYNLGQVINRINHDRKVVFTHGIFDFFHEGHLYFLKKSAEKGGKLVVGVSNDDYVRHSRKREPIFNLRQRMNILSSLEFVDYVFPFGEKELINGRNYYANVYQNINPDLVTWGTEYGGMKNIKEDCIKGGISFKNIIGKPDNDSGKRKGTTDYINKIVKLHS